MCDLVLGLDPLFFISFSLVQFVCLTFELEGQLTGHQVSLNFTIFASSKFEMQTIRDNVSSKISMI